MPSRSISTATGSPGAASAGSCAVTGRGGGRNGEGTSDRSATAYGRPPRGNPISNWSASATGLRSRSPRRYRYLPCGSQVGLESRSTGRVTYADRPLSTFTTLTAEVFTGPQRVRSEEHTSELQSHHDLVCRLLLE